MRKTTKEENGEGKKYELKVRTGKGGRKLLLGPFCSSKTLTVGRGKNKTQSRKGNVRDFKRAYDDKRKS